MESLDQSFEVEGLIPPLFKDLFEEERELRSSVFEPESQTAKWQSSWLSKEGSWWSKWGKFFPYFREEISKDELEKPMSELKKDSSEHVLPFSQVLPFLPDFELKDYLVELKLRPDYNQAKFGIAVRYNPEDGSGYYLWIEQIKQSRASGYKLQASGLKNLNYNITLEKKTKGKSTILQDTIYTNTLRWFIIEVMVDGERIEVSVDGKKVIKVKDSEISKGQIALISEQRLPLTVIDDFVVRPIGKKGMFSKKSSGKDSQPIAQAYPSSNPSSILNPSTPAENIYAHKEGGKGPNAGNGYIWSELYEPLNFPTLELETLNPEPSPALVYQTTSALPSSELLLYYHHDHLGNIRAVTDQNRNVVERHDFYPFGEEITTQPQSKDQFLFTGKPRDSETGLDYFGARYYSSSLSRFLSVDPGKPNPKIPQTLNKYTYCLNNPLKYIDPSGKYFVVPYNDPNRSKILRALALGALTPSGSRIFWQIQRDPRPVIIKSGKLSIERSFDINARKPATTIVFGKLTAYSVSGTRITSIEFTVDFENIKKFWQDTLFNKFGKGRIDPKGITTVYHELLHAFAYLTNPWPRGQVVAWAQDQPSSASGEAQQFGETVFREYEAFSKLFTSTALDALTQPYIEEIEFTQWQNMMIMWDWINAIRISMFGYIGWSVEQKRPRNF